MADLLIQETLISQLIPSFTEHFAEFFFNLLLASVIYLHGQIVQLLFTVWKDHFNKRMISMG